MACAVALAGASRDITKKEDMPTIQIQMFEGRSKAQRQELARAITQTTCRVLDLKPESVDIVITEVKPENWVTAGKAWSD